MKLDVIKNVRKLVVILIVVFCISCILFSNKVNAVNMQEELNNIINSTSVNIENIDNISSEEILNIYDEIADKYTNEEIADMILDNKEQISSEAGISEGVVEAGAEYVRNTSKEAIRDIIADEKNIDKIKESLEQGESVGDAVTSIVEDTIDEAPFVYKPMQEIIDNIKDTVEIEKIIKPIYNFKAKN